MQQHVPPVDMTTVLDPAELRSALGKFATGVAILTTATENGPVGITINSFASVSLDPPLVLFSLGNHIGRLSAFTRNKHYAVHILRSDQSSLCWDFTKSHNAFLHNDTRTNEFGIPIFDTCLARFELELDQLLEGGDHKIFLCYCYVH